MPQLSFFAGALWLGLGAMACWTMAAWMFRAARWRFELYAVSFFLGACLTAVAALLTVGSMGGGVTGVENLAIADRDLLLFGALAGAVLALGVLFQLALATLGGLAVSFAMTMGMGLAVHLRFSGVGLVAFGAGMMAAAAYWRECRKVARVPGVGVALGVCGGIAMGFAPGLLGRMRGGEIGLDPYPAAVVVTVGMLAGGVVSDLFFANLPVRGAPVGLGTFAGGGIRQQLAGLGGGGLWVAGLLCLLSAAAEAGPVWEAAFYGVAIPVGLAGMAMRERAGGVVGWVAIAALAAAIVLLVAG